MRFAIIAVSLILVLPVTQCYSSTPAFLRTRLLFGTASSSSSSQRHDSPYEFFDEPRDDEAESLTIPQLKQQLRLRGLRVSGRKSELVDRLLGRPEPTGARDEMPEPDMTPTYDASTSISPAETQQDELEELMVEQNVVDGDAAPIEAEVMPADKSKARKFAESRGKDLIDVTPYVEENEAAQGVRTANKPINDSDDDDIPDPLSVTPSEPEAWGVEAKIVDDYEGRSIVVDNLNRFVVEFKGSNQTTCQAFVVASRDALQKFLAGGSGGQNATSAEARLREIQTKREEAAKTPSRLGDDVGLDQDDDEGYFKDILHREFSDWGAYTATGAQLSATEVQGVLLLSDVYGPFTNDTRALAEKIAFECQPVVVMAPDVFRGNPWKEVESSGLNDTGESYEQWRARHDDRRVNIDIRAAAACLRERYAVTSIAVWGTCYGGGRALEAATGYFPDDNVFDVDGNVGPLPVDPMACVAWYPTRYNVRDLFGKSHRGRNVAADGSQRQVAVMAIFAGDDTLDGATPDDAAILKECLAEDNRVKDFMVKVFPNQKHGFAHIGRASIAEYDYRDDYEDFVDDEFGGSGRVTLDTGEAEVACLLSTAWMETYSRVFLPTVGPLVSKDDNEVEWQRLEMKDLNDSNNRDIREEIDSALNDFTYAPDGGGRKLDRFDEESHEELKKILMDYQTGQDAGENQILQTDDINTAYEKLRRWDSTIQLF